MKRFYAVLLAAMMIVGMLTGCSSKTGEIGQQEQIQAEASGLTLHKIGVATYNVQDAQVMMFKDYLDNYIKECFADVTFLYSESIASGDEMMAFLQACADAGCDGVMFFYTSNFQKEVEFCAANKMYCIRPSGNVTDAEFAAVADNPYFLGEIGPGAEAEYEAAAEMTEALAAEGNSYVILSGGAFMGNEMHRQRTIAMLDVLQKVHGVKLDKSSEELAATAEMVTVESGSLKFVICPGYIDDPIWGGQAAEAITSGTFNTVLATIPVTGLMESLNSVEITCGSTDCFSEDNYFGFKKGKVGYIAGKYQSEIGPAFAALYNAVTGNADLYRENGKAFRLKQGFWTAANEQEYDSAYALACGAAINAYNYEDLYASVKVLNPDANFADFKALVEAWTYEDCLARRSE